MLTSNQLAVCWSSWVTLLQWGSHPPISGWILISRGCWCSMIVGIAKPIDLESSYERRWSYESTLRWYWCEQQIQRGISDEARWLQTQQLLSFQFPVACETHYFSYHFWIPYRRCHQSGGNLRLWRQSRLLLKGRILFLYLLQDGFPHRKGLRLTQG